MTDLVSFYFNVVNLVWSLIVTYWFFSVPVLIAILGLIYDFYRDSSQSR